MTADQMPAWLQPRGKKPTAHIKESYDLWAPARVITPPHTPLVNVLPRVRQVGPAHHDAQRYMTITRFNVGQPTSQMEATRMDILRVGMLSYKTEERIGMVKRLYSQQRLPPATIPAEASKALELPIRFTSADDYEHPSPAQLIAEYLYTLKEAEETVIIAELLERAREHPYSYAGGVDNGGVYIYDAADQLHLSHMTRWLHNAYQATRADPEYMVLHPRTHQTLAYRLIDRLIDSSRYLPDGSLDVPFRPVKYENTTTGREIILLADRSCPEDVMLGFTLTMPWPVDDPDFQHGVEIDVYKDDYRAIQFTEHVGLGASDHLVTVDEMIKVPYVGGMTLMEGIMP